MDQKSSVRDSTSNLIFLNDCVFTYGEKLEKLSNEQYMQSAKSISAPALIFELNSGQKRYYFRPFGQDKSLLVGAISNTGIWKVNEYFENPSSSFSLFCLTFLRNIYCLAA